MQVKMIFWKLLTAIILSVPLLVMGADRMEYLGTTKTDPVKLCIALGKKLPLKIVDFRKLGQLVKETVQPDSDYCYETTNQCQIYNLDFNGLSLYLIEKEPGQTAYVLTLKLTKSNWSILDVVRVGQKISDLETYFGVKIPKNVSPIGLIGEAIAIEVEHKNGVVTGLHLDCQAGT
jgi:hypothetical protein